MKDDGRRARTVFMQHNRKVWCGNGSNAGPSVLVEMNSMYSSHVAYAYLANVISDSGDAQIRAMIASPSKVQRYLLSLPSAVRRLLLLAADSHFRVYHSFGTSNVIGPSIKGSRARRKRARQVSEGFLSQSPSKSDFLTFSLGDVQVGDLIYDSFLKKYKVATADLTSRRFHDFFRRSVSDSMYWCEIFDSGRVRAVVVSHSAYLLALPARVAISRDVAAFQANGAWIYQLSTEFPRNFQETLHYPSIARQLDSKEFTSGCKVAEERITRRFGGEPGVDIPSHVSVFGAVDNRHVLPQNDRTKIVIASPSFFDAPHAHGNTLFADFWEWVEFLGNFSKSVDYDWFIKPHPDVANNEAIVASFCENHPLFTLLPNHTPHHQLVHDGVNAVLTVRGTVGSEFPLLGVPVINASIRSPHIAYSFCFHADTLSAYEGLLRAIPSLPVPGPTERQELLEFYFLHHVFFNKNLFFEDWAKLWHKPNGTRIKDTPQAYEFFIDAFSAEAHANLVSRISAFLDSGAYRLDGSGMLIPSKEHGLKVSRWKSSRDQDRE